MGPCQQSLRMMQPKILLLIPHLTVAELTLVFG
jgi:hypothetical protein